MKWILHALLMCLILYSSAFAFQEMFWEEGRMGITVGARSSEDTKLIRGIVETEFGGTIRIDLMEHAFLAFEIPENAFQGLREHGELKRITRYVEKDGVMTIPELPLLLEGKTSYSDYSPCMGGSDHTPNDPDYGSQWGPVCIDAQRAWNYELGSHDVIVSIIDTGVDLSHVDLVDNIDATIDRNIIKGTDNANDDMGHGTHCSGIVAAVIDNGVGIAGLTQVRIMAVKALNWLGMGMTSDLANAIYYAVDTGADVISMSWGSGSPAQSIEDACSYAYDSGVVLVAASGNDGNQGKMYPAAYSTVISVGALAQDCVSRAWFSNYGETLEIMAPGAHVYSTMPDHSTFWNLFGLFKMNYDYMDGTSMACPHVAGVAGAFLSNRPDVTNRQLRAYMRMTADYLGDPNQFGYGRVDMWPFAD